MKKTQVREHGNFAEVLNAGMQELDITFRELSKQLHISYEHARRLQTGEVLPSSLQVEESAKVVGIPVEQLQLAVEHDQPGKTAGKQQPEKTLATAKRVRLFWPLLESLAPGQVLTAYAMLQGLVKPAKAKGSRALNARRTRKLDMRKSGRS